MRHDLIKEYKYAVRNNKVLILFASFFFFALLTPMMTKIFLPEILKSQFPGMNEETLHAMLDMSQTGSLRSYLGDIFEIGTLIIAFSLCGLVAQEIKENTLVMPLCAGRRFGSIIAAKMIVFGSLLLIVPTLALLTSYVYAGLLFSFEVDPLPILVAGLLQGIYMNFLLSCLLFFGSVIKKPIAAGFISLGLVYLIQMAGGLFDIHKYLPSGILAHAGQLTSQMTSALFIPLAVTIALIASLLFLTNIRLKTLEWNER